jgi:hypothetical protein
MPVAKMHCAQKVRVPNALALYEGRIDIGLAIYSCFARKYKVQFWYADTSLGGVRANAFRPDKQARFIICYSQTHACVISREPNALLLAFDSVQYSELNRHLQSTYKGSPPIQFADPETSRFTHPAVQLDLTSCLAIAVVYIHLRAEKELDHDAAIRKLTALKHYQIREYCFILLGIIQDVHLT